MNALKKTENVFIRKKRNFTLIFLVLIGIFAAASFVTGYNPAEGVKSFPAAVGWIITNLIPDHNAMERFPKILSELMETALLSTAVTVTAAVFAFFFSLPASAITKVNGTVKKIVRMIAAFFRNVPDVVWAMTLMFSFGQNILTGFFALFFVTFGLLTRAFIETIDEVSADCIEALDSTGCPFLTKVFQGVLPSSLPGIVTWILYMIETNIRSSTLIGILTATGIGALFDLYYKRLDFSSASLVVLSIVVLVLLIETTTNQIRKVIL